MWENVPACALNMENLLYVMDLVFLRVRWFEPCHYQWPTSTLVCCSTKRFNINLEAKLALEQFFKRTKLLVGEDCSVLRIL